MNPALDVATFLATGMAALTLGGNVFVGEVRANSDQVPKSAVFVKPSGGAAPERVASGATQLHHPIVHIYVRWSRYEEGLGISRSIKTELQEADISGYMDIEALQSEPIGITPERDGEHMFMMSFRLQYEE